MQGREMEDCEEGAVMSFQSCYHGSSLSCSLGSGFKLLRLSVAAWKCVWMWSISMDGWMDGWTEINN